MTRSIGLAHIIRQDDGTSAGVWGVFTLKTAFQPIFAFDRGKVAIAAFEGLIRPFRDEARGMTTWLLSRTGAPQGMTIAKLRVTRPVPARLRVHPGRDWFTVLSGTIVLRLGERTILVRAGEAAEFSTMEPHAFGVREGAAEMLCILDHDGTRTHLGPGGPFPETGPGET